MKNGDAKANTSTSRKPKPLDWPKAGLLAGAALLVSVGLQAARLFKGLLVEFSRSAVNDSLPSARIFVGGAVLGLAALAVAAVCIYGAKKCVDAYADRRH